MKKIISTLRLLFYFFARLTAANFQLARDLLRPQLPFQSSIFAYSVKELSSTETFFLLSLISLTPGTLTIDHIDEKLYIHTLYGKDEDLLRQQIDRLAELIQEITSTKGGRP